MPNLKELEDALVSIKRDQISTKVLNVVLDSKHQGAIETVSIILKQRFLMLLLTDPDVYDAQSANRAFDYFSYFAPMEAEIYKSKMSEKDEYWEMKKDSKNLQFLFKIIMKSLIGYIVIRMIYESF